MRSLLTTAVLLIAPVVLEAQLAPVTPAECQAQADSLLAGVRTPRKWSRLKECGAVGATALATAIQNAQAETDSIYLMGLTGTAAQLKSAEIMQASAALVRNAAATIPARVMATFVTLAQYRPSISMSFLTSWSQVVAPPSGSGCPITFISGVGYASVASTPTPSDVEDAAEAFQVVAGGDDGSAVMRDLAQCARTIMLVDVPYFVNDDLVHLNYRCGTRFHVENDNKVPVELSYRVMGTSELGEFDVGAQGQFTWETDQVGTVELLRNGQVIQTHANAGTTCPP